MTEKRKRDSGPPTAVMLAYKSMERTERMELTRSGTKMLLFTTVVPMTGEVVLAALDKDGLPAFFWLFSGLAMLISICLMWPPLGLWALEAVPSGLAKILPGRLSDLLKRQDRRAEG